MSKKEIMNNGFRMKRDAKITVITTIFLVFLFTLSAANTIHFCSATSSSSADLTAIEKIVEERFVDNISTPLDTQTYYRNSIVHFNITVLPQSNSSVEIFYLGTYATDFSPVLTNTTLVPGESFAENYTFVGGIASVLGYYCRCTLADSNATILWWYEVLFSAKPEGFIGIDFLFISGAFILSSVTLVLIVKKKSNKKND